MTSVLAIIVTFFFYEDPKYRNCRSLLSEKKVKFRSVEIQHSSIVFILSQASISLVSNAHAHTHTTRSFNFSVLLIMYSITFRAVSIQYMAPCGFSAYKIDTFIFILQHTVDILSVSRFHVSLFFLKMKNFLNYYKSIQLINLELFTNHRFSQN